MEGIEVIRLPDAAYPPLLRHISDPPRKLYVRGNVSLLQHEHLLAVVGSRKSNQYGKQCIDLLLPPAIRAGVVVVSGLAYGIDSLAHHACVAEKKPTVVVLGSGIDDISIYPRHHLGLAHQILEYGGAIISEYPLGTPPFKGQFPERNRVIAGLCKATLVVQASEKSGSLITARLALEYNREVRTVPGPINSMLATGVNRLIQEGAHPVLAPRDILDLFNIDAASALMQQAASFSPEQQTVFQVISQSPLHVEEIAQKAGLPTPQVSSLIVELELLEAVEHIGAMKYVRKVIGN